MAPHNQLIVSGIDDHTLLDQLTNELNSIRPKAICCASAFVSSAGVNILAGVLRKTGNPKCRLLAGVSGSVTHPEALYNAVAFGWELRLGSNTSGIFHPKMIVAGADYSPKDGIEAPSFAYIGSGNLTHAGLCRNVEVGVFSTESTLTTGGSSAFAKLWRKSVEPNEQLLADYAENFADRNRQRSIEELDSLGIYDADDELERTYKGLLKARPPKQRAISTNVARAAWAGAQSFTGGYMFQMEFPRRVGEIIAEFVRKRRNALGVIPVYCRSDKEVRGMLFDFYPNAMYRLNIPNDIIGVEEARDTRLGIVLVWASNRKDALIELEILHSDKLMDQIVSRSVALGTWDRTSTRAYGWF